MKKVFTWSQWSIGTKILILFLGLSIISMGVIGYLTNKNIRDLGAYAIENSSALGQSAIEDSTNHLNQLGENIIEQKSKDVAKQVEMYLEARPPMTVEEMRADQELRSIVVQQVGTLGYTTLIDPVSATIIIHKYPAQEKNLESLKETLPTFWALLKSSVELESTAGYYDWLEVDGTINQKFAGINAIETQNGLTLTLWATTYITEFSMPAELTKEEINAAIQASSDYINDNVNNIQNLFFIVFAVLVVIVAGLALLLSRVITNPIQALKTGAEAIGKGNLDYKLKIKNKDELGELANTFNNMALELKNYTERLKSTAAENIENERKIQENLRVYMREVGQAQENERKRIARELHDDTIQALVAVSRDLEELESGNLKKPAREIRKEIRTIIEGLRRFSQELRPSIIDDLGLIPAVKWLGSEMEKNDKIDVETKITGAQRQLRGHSELMIFRVIQEALTNVRRHSHATKVNIEIGFWENKLKIQIRDNGKGFKIPAKLSELPQAGKLGLLGISERVQLIGGSLDIKSQRGKGTVLTIDIPLYD